MSIFRWVLGFVLVLGLSSGVLAEEPSSSVAVLDLQRAIMMTDSAKEEIKKLETQDRYVQMQKNAESLRDSLMKKQEALQKDGPTWSAEKRNGALKDMEFLRKDFDLAAQKLQTENQAVVRKLMTDMENKVKAVLEQLIKDEKLSVVLDKNAAIFADKQVDITQQLTDRLNKAK